MNSPIFTGSLETKERIARLSASMYSIRAGLFSYLATGFRVDLGGLIMLLLSRGSDLILF